MAHEDIRMLVQAIGDYTKWVKDASKPNNYRQMLMDFLAFTVNRDIAWKDMFTVNTLKAFRSYTRFTGAQRAMVALSDYLFSQNRINQPLEIPTRQTFKQMVPLPELYEQYLLVYEQSSRVSDNYLKIVRSLLARFQENLENKNIGISDLEIENLDAFLGGMKLSNKTKNVYRSQLRRFLKYLYHERKIIKRDLAELLVGPRIYAKSKPPKFLRPNEIQKLFSTLEISTPRGIRTYAMIHLAYTMALRPVEISRITLDDISFPEKTLTMPERKGDRPMTLPIPEKTMKAMAAYILRARVETQSRNLFMTCQKPYHPLKPGTVVANIWKTIHNAGLSASAYWLRHTYAQNLLLLGRPIYEIKEMLGHQNIQHTQGYLHIDTELMRKVIFDETL